MLLAGPKVNRRERASCLPTGCDILWPAVRKAEVDNVLLPSGSIPLLCMTPEQLQVTDVLAVLVRNPLGTPASGPSLTAHQGDTIFNNSVSSYDNDLSQNVFKKIKIKIANFGWFLHNFAQTDSNNVTKYLSLKDGNLAVSAKAKTTPFTDIQVWKLRLLYLHRSMFAPTLKLAFLHRVNSEGWRDYDIQFRQKKEHNPQSMSYSVVLWPLFLCTTTPMPPTQKTNQ